MRFQCIPLGCRGVIRLSHHFKTFRGQIETDIAIVTYRNLVTIKQVEEVTYNFSVVPPALTSNTFEVCNETDVINLQMVRGR